jgi:cytoplasmic iron level regulating protein YaaA (DUF328/UPF0246 family)
MKVVISPAKSLNYESKLPTGFSSNSCFLEEAERLNSLLKKKSPKALCELMHISPKLGELNYNRNQNWSLPFTSSNARQAIYAFSGDVYRGLDAYTISEDKMEVLQHTVRIISGLYGLLKPMDLIQPYRLEMGTRFPVGKHKNLYEFWRQKITTELNNDMSDDELLVNLASQEYFKAIDTKVLKAHLVHVAFKEYKNGQYKTIAIFSKLARGLMTRHIVDTNAQSIDDLKTFNMERYAFDANLSSANTLVFTR